MDDLPTNDGVEQVLPDGLEERERHRLLADERRRALLESLAARYGHTDQTTLGELATDVDRADGGDDDGNDTDESLLVTLHHVHLPVLDDAGVVSYDADAKRVDIPAPDGWDRSRKRTTPRR